MDSRRAAPSLGIVSSLAVVAVLAVPYLLVENGGAVGVYYGTGLLTPWASGLLALVAVIIFAAGREGRTDPVTAASIGFGFGVVIFIAALVWAATVDVNVALQLTTDDPILGPLTTGIVLEYHRWLFSLVSFFTAVAGGWYARTLGLL